MPNTTSSEEAIGRLELFVNPRDSSDTQYINDPMFINDSSYANFGKHFQIDGSNNKLYVSSGRKSSNPNVHLIKTMQICLHNQTYNSSSDTCYSVSSNYISTGVQGKVLLFLLKVKIHLD